MSVRARVEREVARAAVRHALWPAGARLVVAVSGGPDSLCLLGALHELRERGGRIAPSELLVAHLDHGLRGENSVRDAEWVVRSARDLGLECVSEHADVRALARQQHRSLEDAARRARYAFLRRVVAEAGADRICVGHTLDDQAETIVMHLLRGSGLAGLSGMPYLRGDVARPLLALSRADTTAYCAVRGWTPLHDPTNADPTFTRNRIRSQLLPALESYNPNLRQTLARNAALLAGDERLLTALADVEWDRVFISQNKDHVCLSRGALHALAPALRHRLIRRAVDLLSLRGQPLGAAGLLALDALLDAGETGSSVHLPDGLRVRLDYVTLMLESQRLPGKTGAPSGPRGAVVTDREWQFDVPGELVVPELGWRLRAWISDLPAGLDPSETPRSPVDAVSHAGLAGDLARSELRAYVDAGIAGLRLRVRTWRPGDRLRPLGMTHDKKVQDIFADAKVPRGLRHRLPLVYGESGPIWLAGLRIDDRVRVTASTRRVLALHLDLLDAPEPGSDSFATAPEA